MPHGDRCDVSVLINVDVPDLERAIAFYANAFGLAVGRRFGAGGVELIGWQVLLGYNLPKEQVEQAAIAMIVKIQAGPSRPKSDAARGAARPDTLFWDSFDVKKRIDRVRPKGILENHLLPAFGIRPSFPLPRRMDSITSLNANKPAAHLERFDGNGRC